MVSASARRQQVEFARPRGLSLRRACKALRVARSWVGYKSKRAERDAPVRVRMRAIAGPYPRYGYRRIRIFLKHEGHAMSPQRAHRL